MKKIEIYETEDGKRFNSESEAIRHEKEFTLIEWLRKKHNEYEDNKNMQNLQVFRAATTGELSLFLKYNKDDLISILLNLD